MCSSKTYIFDNINCNLTQNYKLTKWSCAPDLHVNKKKLREKKGSAHPEVHRCATDVPQLIKIGSMLHQIVKSAQTCFAAQTAGCQIVILIWKEVLLFSSKLQDIIKKQTLSWQKFTCNSKANGGFLQVDSLSVLPMERGHVYAF